MACPFFIPTRPMREWRAAPRVPLGEPYWGACRASAVEVPEETLRELCNFGNARGRCARFPGDAEFDAVSLTEWDGGEVRYILERSYTPAAHGRLGADGVPEFVIPLACAFVNSGRRRKEGA